MRIYLNLADRGACSHYRARLPAIHCTEDLKKEGIELVCSEQLDPADFYDAYVFHRISSQHFLPALEKLKKEGKKIVLELDDDVWHIPAWNPASVVVKQTDIDAMNWTLSIADQVWVSTEDLAAVVRELPDTEGKVKVLPNLIDPVFFPIAEKHDPEPVRIMWAGSIHHEADLEILVPVVERLIARYGQKIEVLFFGHFPLGLSRWVRIQFTNLAVAAPRTDLAGSLSFVDPVDLSDYPTTLEALEPDIGLCPLVPVPFNNSKSGIKFFEYTLAGACVVATDLPPYQCITSGKDGVLLPPSADTDAWVAALSELIDSRTKRNRLRKAALKNVNFYHSWYSKKKTLWLDAFRSLGGVL